MGPFHSSSLKEAKVVVTGASSGIGRAIALAFAREGADLVLSSRNEDNLLDIVQECQNLGARAISFAADTTSAEEMEALAQVAFEAHDEGLDVWVNCAGIGTLGDFSKSPLEAHVQVVRTNLIGYMNGTYAALPFFRESGKGTIINLNSLGAWIPMPYASGYSASKFGLLGFMEALRGELAREPNIHVCDLYPTFVDTPGFLHAANYTGASVKPIPPMLSPEKVAEKAVAIAKRPSAQNPLGWPTYFARATYTLFPKLTRNLAGQLLRDYFRIASPTPKTEGHIFESHRERGRTTYSLQSPKVLAASREKDRALSPKVKAGSAVALLAAFSVGLYLATRKKEASLESENLGDLTPEISSELRRKLG